MIKNKSKTFFVIAIFFTLLGMGGDVVLGAFKKEDENRKYDKFELKKRLSDIAYRVTQEDATEKPFDNPYYNLKEDGIYVDVISGEPLFSSKDKFDSQTGWPSFTKPISENAIIRKKDFKLIYPRTEVRSRKANSHLGHVFNDGPLPEKTRYCINSAALVFIAKNDLAKKGYGEYQKLFDDKEKKSQVVLAGGCFWGMEYWFNKLKGVTNVIAGYSGGFIENPTYEEVKSGQSGHAEAILIEYDEDVISFRDIIEHFFKIHDPTTLNRQGNDVGSQYRSAIYYADSNQELVIKDVIKEIELKKRYSKKIVTEIKPLGKFYKAEEYHQDYLQKNPDGYNCHFPRY